MTDLYGSDPMEQAKIDMIVETANEFRERWVQDYYTHLEGEAYVSITVICISLFDNHNCNHLFKI